MRRRRRVATKALKAANLVVFVGTMYAAIIVGLLQYNFGGQNENKEEQEGDLC